MSWYQVRSDSGRQLAVYRSKRKAEAYADRKGGRVSGPLKHMPRDEDIPRRRARRNPGVPLWVWLAGGAVVAGGVGYLIYQANATNSAAPAAGATAAAGTSNITLGTTPVTVPGGFVTISLPINATWVSITGGGATAGSSDQVTINLPSGSTATAVWNNGTAQQTTTITAS
jgi:hypothetical protein